MISASLNKPAGITKTAQIGTTFDVLEISRDQSGLHKARVPNGWLAMLDETGTSLVVELLGPHEAWIETSGYADFEEWARTANRAQAESDAAARNDVILRAATTTLRNGATKALFRVCACQRQLCSVG